MSVLDYDFDLVIDPDSIEMGLDSYFDKGPNSLCDNLDRPVYDFRGYWYTCKYCGKTDLGMECVAGKYKLIDKNDVQHKCKNIDLAVRRFAKYKKEI